MCLNVFLDYQYGISTIRHTSGVILFMRSADSASVAGSIDSSFMIRSISSSDGVDRNRGDNLCCHDERSAASWCLCCWVWNADPWEMTMAAVNIFIESFMVAENKYCNEETWRWARLIVVGRSLTLGFFGFLPYILEGSSTRLKGVFTHI